MADTKRTIRREIVLRFDRDGVFEKSFQMGQKQFLEDGVVSGVGPDVYQAMTLAEAKALVASL